jgi:hypothetical protein
MCEVKLFKKYANSQRPLILGRCSSQMSGLNIIKYFPCHKNINRFSVLLSFNVSYTNDSYTTDAKTPSKLIYRGIQASLWAENSVTFQHGRNV